MRLKKPGLIIVRLRAATTVFALLTRSAGLKAASTGQQVVDEDDHCKYKQDVNETAADMKAEAKKPEYDENDDNRPKHEVGSPDRIGAAIEVPPQASKASWRSLW
jgi:hypothetical protein